MKKRHTLNSDLNKHRRAYRDLDKLKILSNTDVLARRVLQNSIERSSKELQQLNIMIGNVDNKVVRSQNKEFIERFTSLLAEQDDIDNEIKAHKTKISHLKSQIGRVDVKLEKYSTLDYRVSMAKTIEVLEGRLLHSNQKVNRLKLNGLHLKNIVSDLLFMRRRFQVARDNIIARLKLKKQEIIELVDHYTIAFSNGMKYCRELEVCRKTSAKQFKDQLQEMRQLIRAAESNDILREFMITKATQIELKTDAVPQREILKHNYQVLSKECEDQLEQIRNFAPEVTPDDLKYKRRQTFSLYLYENEITENIENGDRKVTTIKKEISVAESRIVEREKKKQNLTELNATLDAEGQKVKEDSERIVKVEHMLRKYFEQIQKLYTMLGCDAEFGFEGAKNVDEFNLDEVLRIIERRLRHVMYSVYCWQEQQEIKGAAALVHGPAIVRPQDMPEIDLITPCPECSQVEAKANPDVEAVMNPDEKFGLIKENIMNRNMMSKMHNIDDCPKPGSKALIARFG